MLKGPKKWLFFLALCLTACSPRILPAKTQTKDSVRVEYRERLVRDTVCFEVPVEVVKFTTRDSMSHLETSLAKSDAAIVDGMLYHSLENKLQTIPIPVTIEVHDTVIIHRTAAAEVVEVTKPLTKAQRAQIVGFWMFIFVALTYGLSRLYFKFRRVG